MNTSIREKMDESMDPVAIPPVGLMPESTYMVLTDQRRLKEIIEAMRRYSVAGKAVPTAWVDELARRVGTL